MLRLTQKLRGQTMFSRDRPWNRSLATFLAAEQLHLLIHLADTCG